VLGERRIRLDPEAIEAVARRRTALRYRLPSGADAPTSLRISADMPSMRHGPQTAELIRTGDLYQGSIVFVMGGEWRVTFLDEAGAELGHHRLQVREP